MTSETTTPTGYRRVRIKCSLKPESLMRNNGCEVQDTIAEFRYRGYSDPMFKVGSFLKLDDICNYKDVKYLTLPVYQPLFSFTRIAVKFCISMLCVTMVIDGSTESVNSREGCVTKCGANFLSSSGRLAFARSPAKLVLTFVYTYMYYSF